jgi:hypothetical protein
MSLSDEEINTCVDKVYEFILDKFKDTINRDDYLRIISRLLVPEIAMGLAGDDPYRLRPVNEDLLLAEFTAIIAREVVGKRVSLQ